MTRKTSNRQGGPLAPIERVFLPFERFVKAEAFGGVLLVLCTVAALAWANSPAGGSYEALWQTPVGFRFGGFDLVKPLLLWINDGLMAVFFFVVGLEIKRELLAGELSSPRQAALPVAAAVGGMVVPAALYVAFNAGGPAAGGWGVPMATDIAFALGILSLMGNRVPLSLKVFLTALAIADDLGAVLVIALFYTHGVNVAALAAGAGILVVLAALNLSGVRSPLPFIIVGLGLWLAFLKSGIHPTVAGVLLAALIPVKTRIPPGTFVAEGKGILRDFEKAAPPEATVLENKVRQDRLMALEESIHKARPPLQRIEQFLHPWVSYGIMPLFALANAGVNFGGAGVGAMGKPLALGVLAGLVLGKPLGIAGASWLVVRLGAADMPSGASWRKLWGVGCLAGIGFTMSLFIAGLAFEGTGLLAEAKMGILAASLASALAGWAVLWGSNRSPEGPNG